MIILTFISRARHGQQKFQTAFAFGVMKFMTILNYT